MLRVSRRAPEAEVRLEAAEVSLDGTRARVRAAGRPLELSLPLVGDFNLENLLVACGVATAAVSRRRRSPRASPTARRCRGASSA